MEPTRHVGLLSFSTETNAYQQALMLELNRLGWVDGNTMTLHPYYAEGDRGKLAENVQSLLAEPEEMEVIIAGSTPAARALQTALAAARKDIPMVVGITGDPNLSPGTSGSNPSTASNITGMFDHIAAQQEGQFKILHDIIGGDELRIGVMYDYNNPGKKFDIDQIHTITLSGVAIDVKEYWVTRDHTTAGEEIAGLLAQAKDDQRDAVILLGDALTGLPDIALGIRTVAEGLQLRMMYGAPEAAEGGGLMAYGPKHRKVMGEAAAFVDRILRGVDQPHELPPMATPDVPDLEFVVNTDTHTKHGLDLPTPAILEKWKARLVRSDTVR